ncbi:DUF4157 domain-containing protein [Rhizobium leguminosarum bv. viciae]|uniref:eCIS core domain-containing protein n=1 Tax=Rhizobium leguminosarum TaxID=384 RepID=UPI001039084F|nr:DUF4157 domain-containing protein [Rhizobium leguminosarum]MBY5530193.1 DUF4157 domain-containing protein [Rhizobium leguminosarum]NKK29618.1 DUF4157 domain-containing protein [Rhizobium leguminosarum bv. viciae]TBY30665.1 DUF4157 domain-containing protein [Rhizobium leguminosarum bv. viciae]TBY35725.1 DUF4157 domain-containing protein [Rhizobium leguminosarum bv. viciae]TBZ54201.1 DUF4157 domain-containing protein [Rhizobium leguminosarum bv. viciae]
MSVCAQSAMQRKPSTAHRHSTGALWRSVVKSECECAECAKKKGVMQRAAVNETVPEQVPDIVYDVLRSSGQPLDRGTREFMEERFNHDFSAVRVHTDARAAESARAVGARAYATGKHIAFGRGEFRPSMTDGLRLLAHELTHVVQQDNSTEAVPRELRLGPIGDSAELGAKIAADKIVAGATTVSVPVGSNTLVLRRELIEEWNGGCGICSTQDDVGRAVHKVVLKSLAKRYGLSDDKSYFPLEGGWKRPDLRRIVDTNDLMSIEIGELKPNNREGIELGRYQLNTYEEQIRRSLETAFELQTPLSKRISLDRLDNIGAPHRFSFKDGVSGRCPAVAQVLTVEDAGKGLFLYSCEPRRSTLSSWGTCCKGKPQEVPIEAPARDEVRNSLRAKQSQAHIVGLPKGWAIEIAAFIISCLTLGGQTKLVRAVSRFASEHPSWILAGLTAFGLLAMLGIALTSPALAIATLLIGATTASLGVSGVASSANARGA